MGSNMVEERWGWTRRADVPTRQGQSRREKMNGKILYATGIGSPWRVHDAANQFLPHR